MSCYVFRLCAVRRRKGRLESHDSQLLREYFILAVELVVHIVTDKVVHIVTDKVAH